MFCPRTLRSSSSLLLACLTAASFSSVFSGCSERPRRAESSTGSPPPAIARAMNQAAESYVKLVLALGRHDENYVDAYYGPAEWKRAADSTRVPLGEIRTSAMGLRSTLAKIDVGELDSMWKLRREYLDKQLQALEARLDFLDGKRLSFDEESRALFDAVAPSNSEAHFDSVLAQLDTMLPGRGPVAARYEAYHRKFAIPRTRLTPVFDAAIKACRERTLAHVPLPADESFTVEYVTDKPWSGYNWYKGNHRSVIQVNTDLPIFIERAIDLACHEGYPGHHVYNVLLEQHMVQERGWVEFSVYPLFSPQSLIAEGSANYGVNVAFTPEERLSFEKEKLYPLAGIDSAQADQYSQVLGLVHGLSYAGNEAARRYLNGKIDARAAAEWLTRYALMEPARAKQRVQFFDKYRSYVINYNLGEDLVRRYVESHAGTDSQKRWQVFAELLSSPRLPSGLK